MADPSQAYDDPAAIAHRLIDHLTATTLRVGFLRHLLQENAGAPAAIEVELGLIEQEIMSTAELARLLRATLAGSEEGRDDAEAPPGETDSGR